MNAELPTNGLEPARCLRMPAAAVATCTGCIVCGNIRQASLWAVHRSHTHSFATFDARGQMRHQRAIIIGAGNGPINHRPDCAHPSISATSTGIAGPCRPLRATISSWVLCSAGSACTASGNGPSWSGAMASPQLAPGTTTLCTDACSAHSSLHYYHFNFLHHTKRTNHEPHDYRLWMDLFADCVADER
jgi:hypothetical protein